MQLIHHPAASRGVFQNDWLASNHTFSFGDYHDPQRMGFGKLRVLNDDTVKPRRGFATHQHDNMEIISIPLRGALRHEDSTGNQHIIGAGEVQLMSAGAGIAHSEYNASEAADVNFLQIWILPECRNTPPAYAQKLFSANDRRNKAQLVISPDGKDGSLAINQQAYFSLADLDAGQQLEHPLQKEGNGLYIFIISGDCTVGNQTLSPRDGAQISHAPAIPIAAQQNTRLLLIETPLD